jgi:hypothetical protein
MLTESKLLDLREVSKRPSFVFGFNVRGVADTSAGLECEDFPVFFFRVSPAPYNPVWILLKNDLRVVHILFVPV